ncbi:sugar transferase [Sulfitobacter sp. M57]|uniref:sugar transferase n=1 Tax=unclassified Sulfitobacter TaxID=196795 RepID=UPI0023E25A30|nr:MULTISPECIES: sugar transferase [unclassified Sulfitobacter]MDF3414217.1 sugar transferase [Sulfitobacter sp. KE5]MDF3420501.1 sugar transferase [Sulfitobacter sp. KE43]MDF3432763.1 sugar transferase [Sulfitobacter sp. KE42]MDF3458403.1 sugar transferase [Sulfitobacter sp. S74]MDF3462303.1 sugar transferase [Sulfitobacter sp. Ks18]
MKDNLTNSADFGIFPFSNGTTFGDSAVAHPSQVWDAALAAKPGPINLYRHLGKRVMDILFVLLTLPFSLPIIGLSALALWLSGGTPFYTQQRLGADGKQFSIFKLRTMVANADQVLEDYLAKDPEMRREWDEIQKLRNDPRITPLGHFLRKTSMDELPQLFNVLFGDMSLVGPRPMMPEQLEMYGDPTHYNAVKPGITGLWQVSARNSERFTYRNEVDSAYERSLTLKLDLTILFKTIGVVLRPTGH